MKLRPIVALTLLSACAFAAQEEDKKSAWDVSSPPGERRDIPIDTHSGTWMSVDVSPDGKRVAFDMLGDVYDLPIAGGEARALASGMAWKCSRATRQTASGSRSRPIAAAATTSGSWMRTAATRARSRRKASAC